MTQKANVAVIILIVLATALAVFGLYRWNSTINWESHQGEGQSGLVALGFLLCCGATWLGAGLLASSLEGETGAGRTLMIIFGGFSLFVTLLHGLRTGYYDEIYPPSNGVTPPL